MNFNSYLFLLLFVPFSLLGYYFTANFGHRRLSIIWLILVSLLFYGWQKPLFVLLLLSSIISNYVIQIILSKIRIDSRRTIVLTIGIVANILLLGYFKYTNFFANNLGTILHRDLNLNTIIIPLAISFFTLQQIAYLVDAYRRKLESHDFLDYSLFVTFFPKLVSGPIVRFSELMPQITRKVMPCITAENISLGLTVLCLGLFQKVIIADNIAAYVTPVFSNAASGTALSFFESWQGALGYTFQLYFDFSGYTNMAIGLAFLFGFRLPLNFYSPYKATSVIDFWRRWHMTLSRFIRDYLYIPLGGNLKGIPRQMINLMIAMIIAGFWHGAGWTFIIWGALHGFYLAINHCWSRLRKKLSSDPENSRGLPPVISIPITFIAVVIAWVFFRANSVGAATNILNGMVGGNGFVLPFGYQTHLGLLGPLLGHIGITFSPLTVFSHLAVIWIFVSLLICWFFPNVQEYMSNYPVTLDNFRERSITKHRWLKWEPSLLTALITSALALIALTNISHISSFIYTRF
jgi:alginate O-acetyltransferase complex protein AlgI